MFFLDEFSCFFLFFGGRLGSFTSSSSTSSASSTALPFEDPASGASPSVSTFEEPAIGAFPFAGDFARAASFFASDALAAPPPVSFLT